MRGRNEVIFVVAMSDPGRVIGREGGLPWRLPEDLERFKRLTMGKPMVMGRKTYASIGRPLPGRETIVVTRATDPDLPSEVHVAHSPEAGLARARELASEGEVIVAGGGELYRALLPQATRIELTRVFVEVEGDTRFPAFDSRAWERVEGEERFEPDERHAHPFVFETWVRRSSPE